jgi:hypothetical protein
LRLLPTFLTAFFTAALEVWILRLISDFVILSAYNARTILIASSAGLLLRLCHLRLPYVRQRRQRCGSSRRVLRALLVRMRSQ